MQTAVLFLTSTGCNASVPLCLHLLSRNVKVPANIDAADVVETVEVIENHTAYLSCPADGIPTPSVMWLHNDVPLLDLHNTNIREMSNGRQLEVRNVQLSDEGSFVCRATNVAGQSSKTFQLKVLGWLPATCLKVS